MVSYRSLDLRSLELHRLIADKLRRQPELFDNARATLARWRTIVDRSSQPYLAEWQHLFEHGIDAALAVALEDSERGQVLRSCSPFCGVLTEPERLDFLRRWKIEAFVVVIADDGLHIAVRAEAHFLPYADFSWFSSAPAEAVRHIELVGDQLKWPALDVALSIDILRHLERFPQSAGLSPET